MATIGRISVGQEGGFSGAIRTLRFVQPFWMEPASNTGSSDKPPAYEVFAKAVDGEPCKIGAVWKKRSENGTEYLWFVLDDLYIPEKLRCFSGFSSNSKDTFDLVTSERRENHDAA